MPQGQTLDQIFSSQAPTSPTVSTGGGNQPSQSLESIFGTSTSDSASNASRPSLDSIFNAKTQPQPIDPNASVEKLGSDLYGTVKSGFDSAKSDLHNNLQQAIDGSKDENGNLDVGKLALAVPSLAGKSTLDIAGRTAETAWGSIGDVVKSLIPDKVKSAYSDATDQLISGLKDAWNAPGDTPEQQQGKDLVHGALGSVAKLAQNNPEVTKEILNGLNVVLSATGSEDAVPKIKDFLSGLVEKAGNVSSSIIDKSSALSDKIPFQNISDVKNQIADKVQGAFKGKTVDEILSTPEDQLQKLSPADRKVYFDTQRDSAAQEHAVTQEQINTKATQTEQGIKAESDKNIATLQAQTQDLTNKADRASIEEAQSLKPKVIQSMKDNSQTYRDLVDKEIANHTDTKVTDREINDFIDNRYADNPSQASAVKEKLGLNKSPETEVTPITKKSDLQNKLPTIQDEEPTRTIGDIYNNVKSLKQDISAAAKRGTKVFTADDKLTDDSVSVLSDFMKSKGVDLSEANKFWRNYAPLRDKIIKNIQPFTPRGSETTSFETFAKDIQKSVKGVDEGNKDFITATEKLLDTKIGNKQVRNALAKLDVNEKAQLAAKIESDARVSQAKFEKEQAIKEAKGNYSEKQKQIDAKEFEANRKAKTRENIWKALKWGTGTVIGLEEFKRLTGI